jgi:hypothetical protein
VNDEFGRLIVLPGPEPEAEPPPRVNQVLVDILENALEEARRGELTGGFIVVDAADGALRLAWTDSFSDDLRRVGAIEQLKHDWLTRDHLRHLPADPKDM